MPRIGTAVPESKFEMAGFFAAIPEIMAVVVQIDALMGSGASQLPITGLPSETDTFTGSGPEDEEEGVGGTGRAIKSLAA